MRSDKPVQHDIEDIYPLSPLQQGMLFHTLLHEDSGVYLMQDRYRLGGRIDEAALLDAWRQVVQTHPSLRASFQWKTQKQPLQVIHREVDLPLERLDLRGLAAHEQERRIRALLEDEQRVGFNLAKPPLIRFRLVRLADESWELIRSFHHILMDAWCISLVMVDFLNAYEALRTGQEPRLSPPRPYRDYIVWLRKQDATEAERYWRGLLAGLSSPTPLVVDRDTSRDRYTKAVHVDDLRIDLDEADTETLHAWCRARRITPNTFFQGAWSLLLARYSGQREVLFGVTVAGRPPELVGVEQMIGLFINTLPLRASVDPEQPLSPWLAGLQALNLRMRDFEHTPLTDIQGWSDFPRGVALFDSILVYENAPIDEKILSGDFSFRLEGMDHSVHTHYGLTVVILPGQRLGMRISYDRERFDADTVQRMLGHLHTLVRGMLAAPDSPLGSFELLTDAERRQLVGEWPHNPHSFPLDRSYAALFAEQAARRPAQVAAVCQGESLTYAELDHRSTCLAHALRRAGAGPGTLVALAAPRGLELLTMMVAVFKAGAAMLPLEVGHPPERLGELLRLSRTPLLLCSEGSLAPLDPLLSGLERAPRALVAEACWRDRDDRPLSPLDAPDDLAYVVFTSGSTGTPKGVMIEQRGMLNNILGKVPALGLGEHDRIAQTASVAFDISVWQFLAAPVLGATVHILPDEVAHDPQRLAQAVADEGLTVLEVVPSLMRALLAVCPPHTRLPSLRWVLPTGEALPPTVARAWLDRFPDIPLMNAYGPAECADDVAFHPIRSWSDVCEPHVPIGRPTANNELYVLDEALRPVPVGVPGEICIGGVGVGRGYLHDDARTRQAFIARPAMLGTTPQARLYRSGDIGRWRADGTLEYLGRSDQQVKLRGQRIELHEIEHRLCQHAAVMAAAVVLREDEQGESHLVGYWQAAEGAQPLDEREQETRLMAHLSAQLPAAMVPARLIRLPELPVNANGKVDRKSLAARPLEWQDARRAPVEPRNDTERAVAEIWCAVLGLEHCGVEDSFFALGGHSLLATQVIGRVRARFKVDLPLRTLFEQPTVAGLAAAVSERLSTHDAAATLPALVPPPRPAVLPLSFAQQRLWFIEQLTPGTTLFNIPFALRLRGELNRDALHASLNALVERHEVLRTSIVGAGDAAHQEIAPQLHIELPLDDLSEMPPTARDAAQAAAMQEVFDTPFDLSRAPLLRARLLKLAAHEHVLAIGLHHMVSDAWSATIALRELALGYKAFHAGRAPALPPLPIQYADFALWQRQQLQGAELVRQLEHWKHRLARPEGAAQVLPLPTDHPRPPVQSYRAGLVRGTLSRDTSERLHALAARLGLTPYAVAFAGFAALMQRLSGESTVLIGTPVTHRERPETEGLLGMLVNNLVIRADFDGQPGFEALARHVGERLDEAQHHQDLPFEQLVDRLQLPRSLSHAPVYQVMVAQQLPMESRLHFPGLEIEALDTPLRHSECDLDLHVICQAGAPVELELMHALDLFRPDTARRLLDRLTHLLGAMLAEPRRPIATLPLLTPAEWQQTVVEWNRTQAEFPRDLGFHQLFEQQAARTPDHVAVVYEGQLLSYDALNRRANQLAHHLRSRGVEANVPVALCVERSLDLFVGLLGILKAGGAYVPLDPAYPTERLAYMLQDAKPALLLGQRSMSSLGGVTRLDLDADWPQVAREPEHDPTPPFSPEQLAYVMYTSGSTGQPKGTLVRHRSMVNLAWARIGLVRRHTQEPLRASFNYSYAFDSSVAELSLLLDGHTLCVIPEASRYEPDALVACFREHRLDAFECTPAQLKPVIEAGDTEHLPRFVLFGGDAIDATLWQRLQGIAHVRFFNTYGPTECTVDATGCEVTASPERPVIGRPIANVRTYVLDAHLNPLPVGMAGELHIGGEGVTAGYLHRPELTAQKFIADPFATDPAARLYKTGDLVRWLPEGQLEYLGRVDHQVKIRGFRVELGEIEARLGSQPGVRQAVVLAREDRPGDPRLVAYLAADADIDTDALRDAVAAELPDYMLPSRFVVLDALPLTGNGKIDRKALPAPDWTSAPATDAPPQGETETLLAALWSDVLGIPVSQIGRERRFFHLGGHSLLAASLFARLRQRFGRVPPLRAIFEQPTLAGLAALLGEPLAQVDPGWTPRPRPARLPLAPAQQRLWFLQQLAGGGEYNVTTALALDGALNIRALHDALQTVVDRHEILRSRIVETDNGPELRIEPHDCVSLSLDTAPANDASWCRQAIQAETEKPFDLAREMPLRACLVRRAGRDEHLLLLTLHHSVTDDASTQVLLDEIAAAYRGEALPPLAMQYADYALWQREDAQQARDREQLRYWQHTLEDGDYVLDLPTDRPRPACLDASAAAVHATLPAVLTQRLRAYAHERGATLYMLLLAGAQLLLGRYANQRDVRIATPVANRPLPQLQPLVGCFVNTLVLRADLDPAASFQAFLAQVKDRVLDAQAHQDVPFEHVVDALAPQRRLGQTPLAQVLFVMQNAAPRRSDWPGLQVRELPVESAAAKFDLNWEVHDDGERLSVMLEYRRALFEGTTVERWLAQWQALLETAVAQPQRTLRELSPLSAAERHRQLVEWNATGKTYPGPKTLSQALASQAARSPEATALVFEEQALSYAALHARADRVAQSLRAAGIGREHVIAVCMERSIELVVALLGIVKSGAAYLPLDTTLPPARLALLLDDADVRITLAQPQLVLRLPDSRKVWTLDALPQVDDGIAGPINKPSDLAYLLYTSGSTGAPKGVLTEHAALMNRLHWMQDAFPIGPGDRVLQKTPYGFDVSVWEFFWPLITGATLVLARPEGHRDPAYLAGLMQREQITTLHFVPSMLRAFVDEPGLAECTSLRQVFASGEALPADLVQRFMSRHPAALVNLYGPTEAAIDVSAWLCTNDAAVVPIGRPIANLRLYILDEALEPLPIGAIGELCIGGVGVARGYLNRPELTARSFVPSPFVPGDRLYRTGDRCRFRPDGEIEYLGRADHQVKLRGQRIELGEIDAALRRQPGVRDAATLVAHDQLVAWWCGEADEAALRAALADALPAHMVPSVLARLDALPINANGKLDRKALAAMPLPMSGERYVAPCTPTQVTLCRLYAELLGQPQVGIRDSFFALGGHSLLATRLVARVRDTLSVTLPLAAVFTHPTVAALADQLRAVTPVEPIPRLPRPARWPLTLAQRRFWMLSRLAPDTSEYHMPFAISMRGWLDTGALRDAFVRLAQRHLVLRSRIVEHGGEPELVVDAEAPPPVIVRIDYAAWDRACAEARRALLAPFDLGAAPPWRAQLLVREERDEALLLLALHHSAADGWAVQLLVDELAQAYRALRSGGLPAWPPAPIDLVDYALWQQHPDTVARREASLAHWKGVLQDGSYQLDLPTDRPRSAEPARDAGRVEMRFGVPRAAAVRRYARERGTTPYVVLATGLAALLARYSGERDIRIGTPADQRDRPETQALLASLVNTLVLRLEVDPGMAGDALLVQLEGRLREAQAHADLPFETLVAALAGERERGRTPLFQVMFSLQHGQPPSTDWPGLVLTELPVPLDHAKFEQSWELHDDGEDIALTLEYQTALYDAGTMTHWAERWMALVDALITDASRSVVELFPQHLDAPRLAAWNATAQTYDGPNTLPVALAASLARRPDAPALYWHDEVMSYRTLYERAGRLAHALRSRNVGPDVIVPIAMTRAPELIVAFVAVALAGAAYLPIDPELPAARIALLVGESNSPLVLTQLKWRDQLPAQAEAWCLDERDFAEHPADLPSLSAGPQHLAYVIYTSGSTGAPKGVMIEQAALMNRLHWIQQAYPLAPNDRVMHKTPTSFDVSNWEVYGPLIAGAAIVLAEPDAHRDPACLAALAQRHGVTVMQFVPAMLAAFVEKPGLARCGAVRRVFVGGEALSAALVQRFHARHGAELVNHYGPTETTIDVTSWVAPREGLPSPIPIGRPNANTRLHVLDDQLRPVPIGAAGELCIGGAQLARGYLHRADLTAERFVVVNGERLYRSGDRCRHNARGEIEYLGRLDHQVKLRGLRIELGEIDAALRRQPGVRDAATLVAGERLVAYWVGDAAQSALQGALASELPAYMVPSAWLPLDALPLMPNGKLDRKALAALPLPQAHESYVAPGTPLEATLCRLYGELLGPELTQGRDIGVHDSFFALGGDSILGLKLIARLREQGLSVTPRDLFRSPTPAALARTAQPLVSHGEQGELEGDVPLMPIQQWFLMQGQPNPAHWNQSVLVDSTRRLKAAHVERALGVLVRHHDALRLRFRQVDGTWRSRYAPAAGSWRFVAGDDARVLHELAAGLDLADGPLFAAALLEREPQRLYLVAHHLVVDAVSWQVLLEDFQRAYEAVECGNAAALPAKTASYRQWAERIQPPGVQVAPPAPSMPAVGQCLALRARWDTTHTRRWLMESHVAYRTRPEELLVAALAATLAECRKRPEVVIDVERHGRDTVIDGLDASRTVGWFTTLMPVRVPYGDEPGAQVRHAKEAMRGTQGQDPRLPSRHGEVLFNYLGQEASGEGWLQPSQLTPPPDIDPRNRVTHEREVIAWLHDGCLHIEWRTVHAQDDASLPEQLLARLDTLVEHCMAPQSDALTPSDFPLAKGMNQKTLDKLLKRLA